jgi:nicotinate-nucleotide adenylyltransferase
LEIKSFNSETGALKVGLFFGSFNPVHIGHLLVATHIREAAQLDEIWFIVSPQNPFKKEEDLVNENQRLEMVKLAINHTEYFKALDIEFNLPKPSYTHTTLKILQKQFPDNDFKLITGEDNIAKFDEWKEAEWIKNNFEILVYNRNTTANSILKTKKSTLKIFNLPLFDISSTMVRNRIKNGLSVKYFVTEAVNEYIIKHNLYNTSIIYKK